MTNSDDPFPKPGGWRQLGVHWHAFASIWPREESVPAGHGTGDRGARLEREPLAVLWSPMEVAQWIADRTRQYVDPVKVLGTGTKLGHVGDEDDLSHQRRTDYQVAERGDSVYADVYSRTEHHNVFLEAVTDEQCTNESCKRHGR
jgi:hypothetical protein